MDNFLAVNPLDRILAPIDPTTFDPQTRSVLGAEVLDFYSQYGSASFGNGLIQSLHPQDATGILDGWNTGASPAYPLLKSSFGTIYFAYPGGIGYVDPVYQDIDKDIPGLDLLLDFYLSDAQFLANSLFKDIHDIVFERLGLLQADEIYAFVPALALGGARMPDHVEKVDMRVQLAFLSRL